jgi:outer membrane protein assembly factor BamD
MKRLIFTALFATLVSACTSFSEPAGERLKVAMGIEVTPILFGMDEVPEVSYAAETLLARAEGHYQEREFPAAADEYARFMSLHATHPWAPFALFRQAMCLRHQVQGIDREPELVRQAALLYENLIANYPDSPAVDEARTQLAASLDHLAAYELEVARYYLRTDRPEAAKARLNDLMHDYPATDSAQNAWYELGQVAAAEGKPTDAIAAYQRFLDSAPEGKAGRNYKRATKALEALGSTTHSDQDQP